MTEEKPQPIPHTQPEIRGVTRGACVLVSIGGFVAGGFATFETDNEIGTSALLLVGVLAGIVAILQRVPKIKYGDTEVDPGEVLARGIAIGADAAADAAEVAAGEQKEPTEVAKAARDEWTRTVRRVYDSSALLRALASQQEPLVLNDAIRRWLEKNPTASDDFGILGKDTWSRLHRYTDPEGTEYARIVRPESEGHQGRPIEVLPDEEE